ncbi:methionyl-tRNA formyltransferase [Campylobacter troglodytis]|nr:methionyl-tRNA formyltransferase [Campylobacter troglodytis]
MGTPSFAARILDELIDKSLNFSSQASAISGSGPKEEVVLETRSNATNALKDINRAKKFDILCVFTNEDKAFGRKGKLKQSEVKALAREKIPQTPIFTPKSLKNDEIIKQIQGLKPDFIVVAAYGKILPKALLEITPCINLHASLLPKYRGASPIQQAILNCDEISGVCAMLMNEKLDAGAVLASEKLNIKDKRASEVFEQMSELAATLCVRVLSEFNLLKAEPQDESKATYCVKIKKEDGLVNLKDAREIYRKFLAFYPWPGVFLENGLKFMDIEVVEDVGFEDINLSENLENATTCHSECGEKSTDKEQTVNLNIDSSLATQTQNDEVGVNSKVNSKAGKILAVKNSYFLLACEKGVLKVKALQEVGKKIVNARAYINGKRLKVGDSLC